MTSSAWGLLAFFLAALLLVALPRRIWLTRIASGQLSGLMRRLEAARTNWPAWTRMNPCTERMRWP